MYRLTIEQKDLLIGVAYDGEQLFNPVQDVNGDWFISEAEVFGCTNADYFWIRRLVHSAYEAPVNELP